MITTALLLLLFRRGSSNQEFAILFCEFSLFSVHKKRTVQIANDDCAVPIFVDNFCGVFVEPIFDVNPSKRAVFIFLRFIVQKQEPSP